MRFSVVIPARFGSTRLPGKALADIGGMPMVQRVYQQATLSSATEVRVATDDQRIVDALEDFGTKALMTSTDHVSGTDRLVEVAEQLGLADDAIIVNVQGDEPLIPPEIIDQVADNLANNRDCACATLSEPITCSADFLNPSVVKVVADNSGKALYFSRAPLPWPRDQMDTISDAGEPVFSSRDEISSEDGTSVGDTAVLGALNPQRHIGIYAYRVALLKRFQHWDPAPLERAESLEQLRILYQGERIHVAPACAPVPGGVDTPDDLERVRQLWSLTA